MPARRLTLSVTDPCSQGWTEVTPNDEGRYCGHCQKTVVDFSGFSDSELFRFFESNHQGVCGRFATTQLNRAIDIPYQPHSRLYRIAIACGLTLLSVQSATTSQAQNRAPKTATQSKHRNKPRGSGSISGRVVLKYEAAIEPSVGTFVHVYRNENLVDSVQTDYDGYYKIANLVSGNYTLVATALNCDTVNMKISVVSNSSAVANLLLHRDVSKAVRKVRYLTGLVSPSYREPKILTKEEEDEVPDKK